MLAAKSFLSERRAQTWWGLMRVRGGDRGAWLQPAAPDPAAPSAQVPGPRDRRRRLINNSRQEEFPHPVADASAERGFIHLSIITKRTMEWHIKNI